MTILAFWSVDNECFGRETMENLGSVEAFQLLWANRNKIDAKFYDMESFIGKDTHNLSRYIGSADDLETDYNDELLDGGHWMKAISISPNTAFKIIRSENGTE